MPLNVESLIFFMSRKSLLIISLLNSVLVLYLCYLVFAPKLAPNALPQEILSNEPLVASETSDELISAFQASSVMEEKMVLLQKLATKPHEETQEFFDREWEKSKTNISAGAVELFKQIALVKFAFDREEFDSEILYTGISDESLGIQRREFLMRIYYDRSSYALSKSPEKASSIYQNWLALHRAMLNEESDLKSFPFLAFQNLVYTYKDLFSSDSNTTIFFEDLINKQNLTDSDIERLLIYIEKSKIIDQKEFLFKMTNHSSRRISLQARQILSFLYPDDKKSFWKNFTPKNPQEEKIYLQNIL